jgi:hypothetical protein
MGRGSQESGVRSQNMLHTEACSLTLRTETGIWTEANVSAAE